MNKTLAFTGAVCTDLGRVRQSNEDNFSLAAQTLPDDMRLASGHLAMMGRRGDFVCGVFDGMGGQSHGEEASKIAATLLDTYRDDIIYYGSEGIKRYIQAANATLCNIMSERNSRMGTTAAVAVRSDMGIRFFNIGDSPIFMLRDNKIIKLSCEHLIVTQLVACGIITAEEAKTDPRRHQLTQHIGIYPDEMLIEAYESECFMPEAGDVFLLCTDGITDALAEGDLARLMSAAAPCDVLAKNIVDHALDAGSRDNATAMVLKCLEIEDEEEKPTKSSKIGLYAGIIAAMLAGALVNVLIHIL